MPRGRAAVNGNLRYLLRMLHSFNDILGKCYVSGTPEKLPPPSNHTLLTTENVDWEYHVTKLIYNGSSMHIMIRPKSPDDK